MPLNELFIRFYERQNGGLRPDDKLVEMFLELSQSILSEDAADNEGHDSGEAAG